MTDPCCPWCAAELVLEAADAAEQTCPECLTTWSYYDEEASPDLALAA